jgi:alkyl hydroperoxide reductase subunit AhpC
MMLGVGDQFPEFEVTGVKPGFEMHEENGESAFEVLNSDSFADKWKIWYFYPKDFTFVCPTEFCKLAWRRDHSDLNKLNQWSFADTNGTLIDNLGIREDSGVAYRATYVVDPHGEIQHVSVNNLNVGRNPKEILRILDALQSDELCPCNRPVGGDFVDTKIAA